mgnify:FL=1
MVDAPDKGGFTGTGRADDDQLFAFLYRQIDIFQDLKVPEIFFQMFDFYHVSHIIHLPELLEQPALLAFLNKMRKGAQRIRSPSAIACFIDPECAAAHSL